MNEIFSYSRWLRRPRSAEPLEAVLAARPRTLQLCELEDRILYSVAPTGPIDGPSQSADAQAVELAMLDQVDLWIDSVDGDISVEDSSVPDTSQDLNADPPAGDEPSIATDAGGDESDSTSRLELVFVDETVHDLQKLLDDLNEEHDPQTQFKVIRLWHNQDGIGQIAQELSQLTGVSAVHIVSHGSDGAVKLGNNWLSAANLDFFADQLAQWRRGLTDDADILFYGCNLAQSEAGQQVLQTLSEWTGADVAASDDATGHADLGGDWELEFTAGSIETAIAFSEQVQADWHSILAVATF